MGLPSCLHLRRLYSSKYWVVYNFGHACYLEVSLRFLPFPRSVVLLSFSACCDWLKKKNSRLLSYQSDKIQGKKQSQPGWTRFPALFAGNVYFIRVLIGLLCALYMLWLTIKTGYREARWPNTLHPGVKHLIQINNIFLLVFCRSTLQALCIFGV